jgi:hypothetical protein
MYSKPGTLSSGYDVRSSRATWQGIRVVEELLSVAPFVFSGSKDEKFIRSEFWLYMYIYSSNKSNRNFQTPDNISSYYKIR